MLPFTVIRCPVIKVPLVEACCTVLDAMVVSEHGMQAISTALGVADCVVSGDDPRSPQEQPIATGDREALYDDVIRGDVHVVDSGPLGHKPDRRVAGT
ncbi:MAG: hypothetical protein M3228_13280 [Actinomycetota bacterium]|nr:hypothetical protein [Actinomycetota bacterium]